MSIQRTGFWIVLCPSMVTGLFGIPGSHGEPVATAIAISITRADLSDPGYPYHTDTEPQGRIDSTT